MSPEPLAAFAALAGQEAFEAEPAGRQPGGHQGGQRRRRARDHLHGDAGLRGAARTTRSPGSEMPGMPASLTTATRPPRRPGRTRAAAAAASLCSCMATRRRARDPGAAEQLAGPAGVLAEDHVGRRPGRPRPGATGRPGCRSACRPARARPGRRGHVSPRTSRRSPTCRRHRSKVPGRGHHQPAAPEVGMATPGSGR